MPVKHIALWALCFLQTLFCDVSAQGTSYFVEKLTIEEGLSSNNINDVAQDEEGFLWVATADGLNRFDGTEVVRYYHQNNANSLPHNYIYCIKKLPGHFLAVGTESGLGFLNEKTGIFQNFYYRQNDPLHDYNNVIIGLETDAAGNLWVSSRNCIFIFNTQRRLTRVIFSGFTEADANRERLDFSKKLLPLSDGRMLLYLYDAWYIGEAGGSHIVKLEDSPFARSFLFLQEISRGGPAGKGAQNLTYSNFFGLYHRFLLAIRPGVDSLLLYDEKGQEISSCFFKYNRYPFMLWSQKVLAFDSSRLLFLFHNYGLAFIQVDWNDGHPSMRGVSDLQFEDDEYGSALCDRQGNWWLGTTRKGLQKISPCKQQFSSDHLVSRIPGKQFQYEVACATRCRNTLWVGTYGDGFYKVDLSTGIWQQVRIGKKTGDDWANFVWNIRGTAGDTIWIGTQDGLFWYSAGSGKYGRMPSYPEKPPALDSVAITTQFADSHGLIWMGMGRGRGVCSFDDRQKRFTYYPGNSTVAYPLRYPLSISENGKGDLWFINDASTFLTFWDRDKNHFQTVGLPSGIQKQVGNLLNVYCGDNDSTLWLGTVMSGLVKFNPLSGSLQVFGTDRGLSNGRVNSIFCDKLKYLWLVTEGGLSCFDQRSETFINYSTREGLPVPYPTANFYYDSLSRHLYSGGNGVIFYFDPEKMRPGLIPVRTLIAGIQVNGKAYIPEAGKKARFSSTENDLTIYYTSVDLTSGWETKYSYKLIGEDTGWVQAGSQRQINFSNLAPGNYTFMVRAANSGGEAIGETASIQFSIRPPFTQTYWFYSLVLLTVGGIFYAMYRFRLRQITRTEQIRTEISRDLHDEVGSTLTNISLSSLLAQKQLPEQGQTNRILERIYQDSQVVSEALREIVWSINPGIDTLGEALPRMLRYASELLESKGVELQAEEIAPAIEKVKLSMTQRRDFYLIFKEALNNLSRHSGASRATVGFQLDRNMLVMNIADDGKGFDTGLPSFNNGLRNMHERARRHHWQLNIRSEPGSGTVIRLSAAIA
jgi:ligand-binding sensor domain-containing protein/two-component sensor histidine kinase